MGDVSDFKWSTLGSHRGCVPGLHLLLWLIHGLQGHLPLALQHGFEVISLPGTVPS